MRTYTTLFLLGLALSVFAARKGKQMKAAASDGHYGRQ